MWLQGEKGDFCLSELFKIKMNPYIASKLVFWYMFSKGIRPLRMAVGSFYLGLHVHYRKVHLWPQKRHQPCIGQPYLEGLFITSWSIWSCIWHFSGLLWNVNSTGSTFSFKFYLLSTPSTRLSPPAGSGVVAAIDKHTRTTESCGGKGTA